MKQIKTIVIVGGGTAGWTTAHNLLARTTPDIKIKVIASEEIETIGVGEGTTGLFPDLIKFLGQATNLNENDFMREAKVTYKYGIKYSNWTKKGDIFYSPLGDNFENDLKYPHKDYDYLRIFCLSENKKYDNNFQSMMMKNNKLAFHKDTQEDFFKNVNQPVAYHLDTYKAGQYLKRKAIDVKHRFEYINDTVLNIELDNSGYIKSLLTKSNNKIEGDLFVDCTGFKRTLISKLENNEFISYGDNLLTNRALAFHINFEENQIIPNYTHANAQDNGWIWEIPTQERLGCGYVFNDNFVTKNDIEKEILTIYGKNVTIQKDIKFEPGRMKKFWIKNVICSGLSGGFVEPLQATSIHNSFYQINHFMENYYKKIMPFECESLVDQYNSEMGMLWDQTRDLIQLHYQNNENNNIFWKESSKKEILSPRLKKLLNVWSYRMPRVVDYVNDKNNNFFNFGNNLWLQILIGLNILNPLVAKQELDDYYLYDYSKNHYDYINSIVPKKLNDCISTNDYYKLH
jgi:flavin-dependent dehydrogenase